jgi:MFS family permease
MGSLFAFPAFQQRFGHEIPDDPGKFNLDTQWQVALGLANTVGNIFGITLNAVLTERFGHKKILIGALVALSCLITIQFRATSIQMLFTGQILCGVPWGTLQSWNCASCTLTRHRHVYDNGPRLCKRGGTIGPSKLSRDMGCLLLGYRSILQLCGSFQSQRSFRRLGLPHSICRTMGLACYHQ